MDERSIDREPLVVLLHSNDIHSRLEEAARISDYIADTRRMFGADRVLAVDIGDHLDRMRPETEGSGGSVNIELLNAAGYEAGVPGNNEGLTYTKEELERLYGSEAKFPVLCCNLEDADAGELPEWLLPSLVVPKNGLAIGLIGATAPYPNFYGLLGWTVKEPVEAIRKQAEQLRPTVDVLVVLSHLGLPVDRRLAEEIPGIDLILGGHTHHQLDEPIAVGTTLLCGTGKFGEHVGRIEIGRDAASGRLTYGARLLATASMREEPRAAMLLERFKESARVSMSRTCAVLDRALPLDTDRESPLANLLAAGVRRWTGADIGLVNSGQLLGGLAAGEISDGLLHSLCPSPVNPCRILLKGGRIRLALEQSLLEEYTRMEIRGFGFRGRVLGCLAMDGIELEWDEHRPPGSRITSLRAGGSDLDDETEYSVGTLDMFTFGVGYLSLKEGRDIRYFLPEFLRHVLAEELRSPDGLDGCFLRRTRLRS